MSENGSNNGHTANPLSAAGGASPFLALDPTDPKDQALIREEIKRHPARWRAMDAAKRDYVVECLGWAMDKGRHFEAGEGTHPLDGAKLVVSAARTFVAIEGQNQADEQPRGGLVNIQVNQPTEFRLEFDRSG